MTFPTVAFPGFPCACRRSLAAACWAEGPGRRATASAPASASSIATLIKAWSKDRAASYKYPRAAALLGALPKGPTGKATVAGVLTGRNPAERGRCDL
jgi:hypothetical protein